MKIDPAFERCLTYINCEIQPVHGRKSQERTFRAVTVSRQSGSGGRQFAEELARILQEEKSVTNCPWTVFDKNLVEQVLQDHNLPARLACFMPEDRISEVSDTMDELFGLRPPSWSLVRDVSETILRLAQRGNVIVIGRGANIITSKLDSVLHLRIIGSEEKRCARLQEQLKLDRRDALSLLRREDRARARYVRKYLEKAIDDPLLYHMVLNTDFLEPSLIAQMIGRLVRGTAPMVAVA